MSGRRKAKVCPAHVAPPPAAAPRLREEVPLMMRLEREVEDESRPVMLARLSAKILEVEASLSAPQCCCCGDSMVSHGRRQVSFICRFGKLRLRPATFDCRGCGKRVRPLLDRLGVEAGRVSGGLARLLALLGVVVPYELAARLVQLFFGVEVCPMTVWRAVARLGAACEEYVEGQGQFSADGRNQQADGPGVSAVVLSVDGCALGMQVRKERRRRQPAQVLPPLPKVEEGHFREVKTGVLLLPPMRVEPWPGRQAVVRRVLCTFLGEADRIFERLWAKLCELGWLGPETVVVIVGDGAEWIWKRAEMFPRRCEILDFWHAVEYAWDYARVRYGEGATQATRFVHRMATDLRAGKVEEVIARLGRLVPGNEEQEEALLAVIRYYTENRGRMRYDEYLRLGYGIGSGAVESAHKQVVHARLRQAGMRWSEDGARRLLALRVLLLNDQWALLDRLTMKRLAA
jgi:hypothetical protein